jgi:hypothetical protein
VVSSEAAPARVVLAGALAETTGVGRVGGAGARPRKEALVGYSVRGGRGSSSLIQVHRALLLVLLLTHR